MKFSFITDFFIPCNFSAVNVAVQSSLLIFISLINYLFLLFPNFNFEKLASSISFLVYSLLLLTFMMSIRKVPWYSMDEWHEMKHMIFSMNQLKEAKQRINVWKTRCYSSIPIAVSCTEVCIDALIASDFMVSKLLDVDPEHRNSKMERMQRKMLTMVYSTAITRFINFVVDSRPRKFGRFSMKERATNALLPDWLVSLRHEISHGRDLPNLATLHRGILFCMDWLHDNYWSTEQDLISEVIEPENTLFEHITLDTDLTIYTKIKKILCSVEMNPCNFKSLGQSIVERYNATVDDDYKQVPGDFKEMLEILLAYFSEKFMDKSFLYHFIDYIIDVCNNKLLKFNIVFPANSNLKDEIKKRNLGEDEFLLISGVTSGRVCQHHMNHWCDMLRIITKSGGLYYLMDEMLNFNSFMWISYVEKTSYLLKELAICVIRAKEEGIKRCNDASGSTIQDLTLPLSETQSLELLKKSLINLHEYSLVYLPFLIKMQHSSLSYVEIDFIQCILAVSGNYDHLDSTHSESYSLEEIESMVEKYNSNSSIVNEVRDQLKVLLSTVSQKSSYISPILRPSKKSRKSVRKRKYTEESRDDSNISLSCNNTIVEKPLQKKLKDYEKWDWTHSALGVLPTPKFI